MYRQNVKLRSIQRYKFDARHRQDVRFRSKTKYATNENYKCLVNNARKERYRRNKTFKQKILKDTANKYLKDESVRSKVKALSKKRYESSSEIKTLKKEAVKDQRQEKRMKLENEEEIVRVFKEKAMHGIDFTCCCCRRILFQNQVQRCEKSMYSKSEMAANVASQCIQEQNRHDCSTSCPSNCVKSSLWICYTCHRKILSGNIPPEAVINNMVLEDIPVVLERLNNLEKHLIGLHIPFMKVMNLPHGGQKNIHGPVVCVPSNLKKVTSLPLNNDEDLLLRVKLKRKLNYKGYFEYQFVNPKHIFEALDYLKNNNQWYEKITVNKDWSDDKTFDEELLDKRENADEDQQCIATDTCLQPVNIAQEVLDHYFDDIYNIAPGEGNNPVKMLQEPGNEAKTFPYLFPTGKFSWNNERDTRITLSRYFNNRLMNTDDRFAKDSNYIFFSQYMSDLNQVIEKTQISVRKSVKTLGSDKVVTNTMVQDPIVLAKLMKNDEALRFLQPIRGTPAYWSSAQKDLFAMLRQLGIPTWFCSFSAAEHRWNDALASILRHQNDNRNPVSARLV